MSLFSGHAKGIDFNSEGDFFEAVGYLAKPGVLSQFEAQVPEEKIAEFVAKLPGQDYYPISTENLTSGGNIMKTGVQLRLYFGDMVNMPISLSAHVVNQNRINRGLFAEELLSEFGFTVGFEQDAARISRIVQMNYPNYITDFERGYKL